MASWTNLINALFLVGKPITSSQGLALRDNVIAQGQADPSVPLDQLPTVFLGQIATTSGSTQTFSGLVLTPYRFLRFTLAGVSSTSTPDLQLGGVTVGNGLATASDTWTGTITLDLANGVATGMLYGAGANLIRAGITSYTNASTSVAFSILSGTFDAGTIRIYGEK